MVEHVADCIHGLENGLCDICFPRAVPEEVRAAAARRSAPVRGSAPRAAGAVRTATRTASGTSTPSSITPSLSLTDRRVYHVTHIANLEAILVDGEIRFDATPEFDVSSALTRELRATADLASGVTVANHVANHVPFSLTPLATTWVELRDGAIGPRWSDAARSARPADFVILAVPVDALGPDLVFADADASSASTRFSFGIDEGTRALRRLHGTDPEFLDAELLVPHPVPVPTIALVGVANDPVRDRVRAMLKDAKVATAKVAVYPPWFLLEA